MNLRAKTSNALLSFLFIFLATNDLSPQPFAEGWAIGPTRYEFNIENAMENGVLNVHCKSSDDDLGLVRLPIRNNYTHGFKTELFKTTLFFCELTAPHGNYKVFDTFKDVIEFVDHQCGGRHCFWKAMDDGIYLYHIQKVRYFKKFDWNRYPPNDEEPKNIIT